MQQSGMQKLQMEHAACSEAPQLLAQLAEAAAAWHGERVKQMSFSAGYAAHAEHPALSAAELVAESDHRMYEEKTAYYKKNGLVQRRT